MIFIILKTLGFQHVHVPHNPGFDEHVYSILFFHTSNAILTTGPLRPCLVPHPKFFHPSHRIFTHMHETLNVHKRIN